MDSFLTIKQFIVRYRISRSTVYREHLAGRLPFVKIGRVTRIRQSDAIAWFDALEVSGRV